MAFLKTIVWSNEWASAHDQTRELQLLYDEVKPWLILAVRGSQAETVLNWRSSINCQFTAVHSIPKKVCSSLVLICGIEWIHFNFRTGKKKITCNEKLLQIPICLSCLVLLIDSDSIMEAHGIKVPVITDPWAQNSSLLLNFLFTASKTV